MMQNMFTIKLLYKVQHLNSSKGKKYIHSYDLMWPIKLNFILHRFKEILIHKIKTYIYIIKKSYKT